jgi:hypothetical protein
MSQLPGPGTLLDEAPHLQTIDEGTECSHVPALGSALHAYLMAQSGTSQEAVPGQQE